MHVRGAGEGFFKEKFDYYATGILEGSKKEELDAFCKEMEVFAQEKHLQTMPEGMIERIAHTPDVEYERPHFAN